MKTSIIGPDFLNLLLNFRICWLAGRFGGGKTALASILAAWLWWRGYVGDVVANYPLRFANPRPRPPLKDCALIVDEAWQFARDSAAIQRYGAFLRKLNNYLILPSVFPLSARLQSFWVERVFNAYVLGIPAWVWRWNLTRPSYRERGYFLVIAPHRVFELYDSYALTADDGMIAALLAATFPSPAPTGRPAPSPGAGAASARAAPSRAPRGAPPGPRQLALPLPPAEEGVGQMREVAAELQDAAAAFAEVSDALADRLSSFVRRLRR